MPCNSPAQVLRKLRQAADLASVAAQLLGGHPPGNKPFAKPAGAGQRFDPEDWEADMPGSWVEHNDTVGW